MNKKTVSQATEDPTLLLVSGTKGDKSADKQYVKKLANAIVSVFYKYDTAKLRCVGAAAINNAVKAFIIAKGETSNNEDKIKIDPTFTSVTFEGKEKTAILLTVTNDN